MWSNLTGPELGARAWDAEAFFAAGEAEIEATLHRSTQLGVAPERRERALDFGCGVGRLTRALGRRFARADGVDISKVMLREARRHQGAHGHCHYHLDTSGHLGRFEDASFDFVYSNLVLQHMEPLDALRYVAELVRVLAPGGLLVFQVPRRVPGRPEEAVALPPGTSRTSRAAALSDTACRARIASRSGTFRVGVGETLDIEVRVTNASSATWPYRGAADDRYQIKLGGVWIEPANDRRWPDEARGRLPYDLAPGTSTNVSLSMRAPRRPGEYRIALDMIQEGVCWFGDRGSTCAYFSCRVEDEGMAPIADPVLGAHAESHTRPTSGTLRRWFGGTPLGAAYRACRRRLSWWRSQRARRSAVSAIMEMHSVPEEEVRPVVARAGGRLTTVDHRTEEDGVESNLYWVTR